MISQSASDSTLRSASPATIVAPGEPERLTYFERYPPSQVHGPTESIDGVAFTWDETRREFHSPVWTPSSRHELEVLIGESYPEPALDAVRLRQIG